MRHPILTTTLAAGAVLALAAGPVAAATATVVVDEPSGDGIEIGAEAPYRTPWVLSSDEASIGSGSLHVQPITNDTGDASKFIAYVVDSTTGRQANDLSVSVDYLVDDRDGDGRVDSDQVYVNVYTEPGPDTSRFYACRYDFVAPAGTGEDSFATLATTGTPTEVVDGDAADGVDCAADLASLPDDATVSYVALNVGDTSANDTGVGAYLDRVVVSVGGDSTVFDLEEPLPSKQDCKDGGWKDLGYRNQGDCVSTTQADDNAGK